MQSWICEWIKKAAHAGRVGCKNILKREKEENWIFPVALCLRHHSRMFWETNAIMVAASFSWFLGYDAFDGGERVAAFVFLSKFSLVERWRSLEADGNFRHAGGAVPADASQGALRLRNTN